MGGSRKFPQVAHYVKKKEEKISRGSHVKIAQVFQFFFAPLLSSALACAGLPWAVMCEWVLTDHMEILISSFMIILGLGETRS